MDTAVGILASFWNDLAIYEKTGLLVFIAYLGLAAYRRSSARCEHCQSRYKKVYDTLWVERMTDKMTPTWEYEEEFDHGKYVCRGCGHETETL